jgi:outer membrane protein assembly factor BamB
VGAPMKKIFSLKTLLLFFVVFVAGRSIYLYNIVIDQQLYLPQENPETTGPRMEIYFDPMARSEEQLKDRIDPLTVELQGSFVRGMNGVQLQWSFSAAENFLSMGQAEGAHRIAAYSELNYLYCLDSRTGALRWMQKSTDKETLMQECLSR